MLLTPDDFGFVYAGTGLPFCRSIKSETLAAVLIKPALPMIYLTIILRHLFRSTLTLVSLFPYN
jgi:hypothetical protein